MRSLSRMCLLAAVLVVVGVAAPSAQAQVSYKTGAEINTAQGNCFPLRAWASYSQQNSAEPRVDDVFYISVYYSFFQTFDCAADFVSAQLTLPSGVQAASDVPPVCRRWGGSGNNLVYDPRATNACPVAGALSGSTFSVPPRPGSPSPDFPGSGRWFIGQVAPQESVLYHSLEFLIPVRATTTMTNQPIGLLVCSVGTSCANGGVNLSVTPAPVAADPPRVSLAGNVEVSAIGARIPFSVNSPETTQEWGLKEDISTNSNFVGGRPCGLTGPLIHPQDTTQAFVGDMENEIVYGDFEATANNTTTPCRLAPGTLYHVRLCTIFFTGGGPSNHQEKDCKTTSFRTGAVQTRFKLPEQTAADLPGNNSIVVRDHQIVGPRPGGVIDLRYKLKDSGTWFVGPTQTFAQSLTGSTPTTRTVGGLNQWRIYNLVSCYAVTGGSQFCADPPIEVTTGFATAPTDATSVGETSAVLSGQASAPSPAGTMRFLLGTSNPGAGDVRTLLTERGSTNVAARSAAGEPVTAAVGGLAPGTQYWWSACFDNPAGTGIEDCSPVRTFTTAGAAPQPPAPGGGTTPGGDTGGSGGDTSGGSSGGAPGGPVADSADRIKPKASIKLAGKVKRGKRVTLTVTASDPSGIRSVSIKVGRAKPVSKRRVAIKLPRKKGTVRVVVTVTDRAGNVTTLTKTLRVK